MRFNELSQVLEEKGFDFSVVADEGSKTGCAWYVSLDKENTVSIYISEDDKAIFRINGKEQTINADYMKQAIDMLNYTKACLNID